AFVTGTQPKLEPLPIQYADFAAWESEWLRSPEAQRQLAYWKQKLVGTAEVLDLPFDRARPKVETFRGANKRVEFSIDLCEAMRLLSRSSGCTLYVTMLTGFYILLHRYTGAEDICVGCAIANRRIPGTDSLLGMVINSIVLRADLSGNPTFRELMG